MENDKVMCVYCKDTIKRGEQRVIVDRNKEDKPSTYAHTRCMISQFLRLNTNFTVNIDLRDLAELMQEDIGDTLSDIQRVRTSKSV